jgi:hypothetical protein
MRRAAGFLLGTFLFTLASTPAFAAVDDLSSRSLENLFLPRKGKVVQFSSHGKKPGDVDSWEVPAGGTVTLVDARGAGVVRRWWMTVVQHQENPELLRRTILRCYWDGETAPSVEAPLADFFGLSFGEWHDYQSLPTSATSGGFNCYWPMPFHSSARITLENRSKTPITGLFFNIEVEQLASLPPSSLYFHAQFRRIAPTIRKKPVVVLETTGSGQYVGTVLSACGLRGVGPRFLEGNERIFVDGEAEPAIGGTGTEDYFSSGLYFVTGTFSAPYHGVTVLDREKNRVGAYRWHITDPIPFTKSLRFEFQHGPADNVTSDYATLAIWYQTHPHPVFPPLPDELGPVKALPPYAIQGLVEAEQLAASAYASRGNVGIQSMEEFEGDWSGDAQLLWRAVAPGDHLTLFLHADVAGEYEIVGYFTQSTDYGDVRVLYKGKPLAVVAGYSDEVRASGPISFGRVTLERGDNPVLLEIAGKDSRSGGYAVGVDGFRLER